WIMSICKGRARRARAAISAGRLPWALASRKPSATSAPAWANASEIARPRPRAAPVTSATWPLRSKVGNSMECPFASKAQFAPFRNGSFLLVHAVDQISHAVRELGYFSLSLDVEIDCAVTRGSAINCFFQVQQRFYNLTRQDESDPHAEQKGEDRNNAEHPIVFLDYMAHL